MPTSPGIPPGKSTICTLNLNPLAFKYFCQNSNSSFGTPREGRFPAALLLVYGASSPTLTSVPRSMPPCKMQGYRSSLTRLFFVFHHPMRVTFVRCEAHWYLLRLSVSDGRSPKRLK
jgi:hypothetical protein